MKIVAVLLFCMIMVFVGKAIFKDYQHMNEHLYLIVMDKDQMVKEFYLMPLQIGVKIPCDNVKDLTEICEAVWR